MANDTTGLMDALGIRSAHIVGASMGGAIAQEIAIHSPERVRSLTSIMSTTGNLKLPQPKREAMALLDGAAAEDQGRVHRPVCPELENPAPGQLSAG